MLIVWKAQRELGVLFTEHDMGRAVTMFEKAAKQQVSVNNVYFVINSVSIC